MGSSPKALDASAGRDVGTSFRPSDENGASCAEADSVNPSSACDLPIYMLGMLSC